MMRILSLLVLFVMLSSLAGCIIHTRGNARGRGSRACPPAHHWNGYGCVHNGRGPKVRDHRR